MKGEPLITLDKISVRLFDKLYLQNISWQIGTHEQWAIVGPNGSGKTTLAKALFGGVPVVRGSVYGPSTGMQSVGYVSPELFRELFEREELEASFRDFSGRIHEMTTARDVVVRGVRNSGYPENEVQDRVHRVADKIGIEGILDRDICALSMGELCKVIIARSLMKDPALLILDEPFNGLDDGSRIALAETLDSLIQSGVCVVLITHRFEEILPRISHVLYMKDGEICAIGPKENVLRVVEMKDGRKDEARTFFPSKGYVSPVLEKEGIQRAEDLSQEDGRILIDMRNVTVRYGETVVLDAFNWRVRDGENWAILGENGAGKSTILKLILGDNLQSYSNEVFVFGRKKGDGVSIWEIKRQIGVVSTELQARYRKDVLAFDVVCSGFHDSIGLYQSCSAEQEKTAIRWMKTVGIEDLAGHAFEQLSYGQRKLTLIARAMVKSPVLLFLDEPCDGLDMANRDKILEIIDYIGCHTHTTLVYITHHENEIVPCITNSLTLHRGKIIESEENRRI
ncbi:MAG: ATP-binding cassette domain-containing protein [Deltaproteobacteria bacterium]|uniref:ATP-binding cassette domain-containing protein n=1 Tax=Candidatus Desulfacyla euxinica TaxID=2841693 RepID=A0A8J6N1F0_9DELT|nr:ATP-binding cassette domain-containing protein [Candidatus Desulfacyla euxinica]